MSTSYKILLLLFCITAIMRLSELVLARRNLRKRQENEVLTEEKEFLLSLFLFTPQLVFNRSPFRSLLFPKRTFYNFTCSEYRNFMPCFYFEIPCFVYHEGELECAGNCES